MARSFMDQDLRSIQQARDLLRQARAAWHQYKTFSQAQVDAVVAAMAGAGAQEAERLGRLAHEETGFGRPESKTLKNLFATQVLHERMAGMKTVGIIRKREHDTLWEIATPMGVVGALVPSTNPTSTAMYKAIIAAKARCGIVMSPHPRAKACTAEALRVVAEAAYAAGAPTGLFGCLTEVDLAGTNMLMEHPDTDVILATGGMDMVKAAYSKGKPAYGVGSGNVPVYVDRSANLAKAAADLCYGASFDWGTLCSTERSVVADLPIKGKLIEALKQQGAFFLDEKQKDLLRRVVVKNGRLNVAQVGQSPATIAKMAGFTVPETTRALVAEVTQVGKAEPLSMETLSPILTFYTEDGWQAGCERCIEVLHFGGIGHTLGLHCTSERVIEAFALEKPAMRIVVNTVAALGSVGYTNALFPAMTLGPGTLGGSIISDNVSPLHLLNIKRLAFETNPLNPAPPSSQVLLASGTTPATAPAAPPATWMDQIEAHLRARAGNPPPAPVPPAPASPGATPSPTPAPYAVAEEEIERLIRQYRKG
jgi:acetaldehyde dehydrogenase (acetylating)